MPQDLTGQPRRNHTKELTLTTDCQHCHPCLVVYVDWVTLWDFNSFPSIVGTVLEPLGGEVSQLTPIPIGASHKSHSVVCGEQGQHTSIQEKSEQNNDLT